MFVSCGHVRTNTDKSISTDTLVAIEFPKLKFDETYVLNLSEIADSISYIQLPNDVLLSEIRYVKRIENKNLIIFTSNNMVYQFDHKLYFPIDAVTISDNGKTGMFSSYNENSNPVIMVIHLKK